MPSPPTSPPAPGEDRSIALALVNTELEPRGEKVDLISDGPALARWLRAHGLPTERGAQIQPSDLDRIRKLRAAVRLAFTARVVGQRPSRSALRRINSASALASRVSRLSWNGDGPSSQTLWRREAPKFEIALAAIAEDAIETLLGDTGAHLRACEAHGCTRLFIQDHGRRRWCSKTCGDRVRVARHYRKVHGPR